MRVKMITLVVALLLGCGLLVGNGSSASQVQQRASQRLTVNKEGTQLELVNADGTSHKFEGDGFMLKYTTRRKTNTVSVIGTKITGLLPLGPLKANGNTVTAVAQTADKSLEITSLYAFNESTGGLAIKRSFRNISKYPVTLQLIQNHIDGGIIAGGHTTQSVGPVSAYKSPITAGFFLDVGSCGMGVCPVGPICPCPPLPPPPSPGSRSGYFRARLYLSDTEAVLVWSDAMTLKPSRQRGDQASILVKVLIR